MKSANPDKNEGPNEGDADSAQKVSIEQQDEVLRLWHSDGREHMVHVLFASGSASAIVMAGYLSGDAAEEGAVIVKWSAAYEPPARNDLGSVYLGNGRIDLQVASLRGIGLGSLLVRPLVAWMKIPPPVPVQPINLSADDAATVEARERRNRFYEKLGFVFDYRDQKMWGESVPMMNSALVLPPVQLSRGWNVESLQGHGRVF